ncbi:MAG: hypothetical protein ABI380_12620 [Edaphobacter sp.]
MATETSKSISSAPLQLRITISVAALAICWFVYGVAFGIYLRDVQGTVAFFIWSLPFFAVGWVLMGIPVIAMGNRILKIPKILLGIAGAVAAVLIILALYFVLAVIAQGTVHLSKWSWSSQTGWPLFGFGSAIGASGAILYAWLFSRANRVIGS